MAGPELWHRKFGIFAMRGPGIRKDERIHGVHLLDIAPTVLTLLGVPVGRDMDGKVLAQCFERMPALQAVDSWEAIPGPDSPGLHPAEIQLDPFEQAASLQQLVDLGYIEAPDADATKAIRVATNEATYNLATSHIDAEQYGRACELLAGLCAANPDNPRYRAALAQSYLALGRLTEMRELIGPLADLPAGQRTPRMSLMLGTLELTERNLDRALQFLREAEAAEPRLPILHVQIGTVYARQRLWADAERAFRKAIDIDPESPQAHFGLGHALLHQGRNEESAQHSLRAVGLTHYFPRAHLQLGIALTRLEWHDRAIQAFRTVLALRPRSPHAHRYLAALYLRAGDASLAKFHQDAARRFSAHRPANGGRAESAESTPAADAALTAIPATG